MSSPSQDEEVLPTATSYSRFYGKKEQTGSHVLDATSQGTDKETLGDFETEGSTIKPAVHGFSLVGTGQWLFSECSFQCFFLFVFFFKKSKQAAASSILSSAPFIEELQKCRADPRSPSHHVKDAFSR